MGAPNPWHDSLPLLNPENQLQDGEHPLDLIREFLITWPGQETVKIESDERHNRLSQVIAGYPEIDVNRFPLDWPLHPKSLKAMRLSRYLDSISVPTSDLSLRSVLLNKYTSIKKSLDENKEIMYRRFLALLLIGIREQDNVTTEGFTDKELLLLGALHSSESGRISKYWPWEEILYYNKIKSGIQTDLNKYLDSHWKDNEDIKNQEQGNIWGIKCMKIQDWIIHWSSIESPPISGLTGRLIRGASALLENIFTSVRHFIISKYGLDSIIIDGGGRIEFLCDINPREELMKAISQSFISPKSSYKVEIEKTKKRYNNDLDFDDYLHQNLPKFVVYESGNFVEEENHNFSQNEVCPLCNNKKIDKKIASRWDRLIEDETQGVCDFHAMLYYIGQGQRFLDSTIRNSGKGIDVTKKQREVCTIARIDINSLGILFTKRFDDKNENTMDVKRRRSFRFNSHWWNLINQAIDSPMYSVDQIAAWMAAGDDIIFAEYNTGSIDDNFETSMQNLLSDISTKLHKLSEEEFGDYKLTFSGGLAARGNDKLPSSLRNATKFEKLSKLYWRGKMKQQYGDKYLYDEFGNEKPFNNPDKMKNQVIFTWHHDSLWIQGEVKD